VLRNQLLQLGLIGSHQVGNLDTVLDEDKGGHGSDVVRLGALLVDVNVHLEEDDLVLRLGHLLNHGSDLLAGAAPLGEEVDDD